ncbi:MAG: bifunctional heptose 7-phosphate kinase/heptose 1-phosphate adenyltransferase [Janthinobacterium lividum]
MNEKRALEILDNFMGKRVLVVGDVMLDEYVWGRVNRVSPEAPVMIVDADSHTFVPGGAANVVNNVCALGGKAFISGIIGTDSAAVTLKEKLVEEGADVAGLVAVSERPTTLKTRVIAHTQQGAQQVVRVDHERRDAISPDVQARMLALLHESILNCDALLLSDYQKGLLTRELVASVVQRGREQGKIVTGNLKPKGIASHCRLSMITLNVFEASEASGLLLGDGGSDSGTLHEAGRMLLRKSGAENVLITRGAHGLSLFSSDGTTFDLPAHPVEVFDGTGAGDTTITTLTLALASGATPKEAVTLANAAGAVVVRKLGVATATRAEILERVIE